MSVDALQYDRSTLRLSAVLQETFCIGALLLLWFRRNCVLDLWLLVLSFTLVLEVTMSSLLAAGRFDVGWYLSRAFALTASTIVLIVLLSETTTLYAQPRAFRTAAARRARGAADRDGRDGRLDRARDQPAAGGNRAQRRGGAARASAGPRPTSTRRVTRCVAWSRTVTAPAR